MFGLSKKKQKEPTVQDTAREHAAQLDQAYKSVAEEFLSEETDILAVTGPDGAGSDEIGQTGLWKVTVGLTAWMDEYAGQVQRENAQLEAVADDKLKEYLMTRVPRDFLISVTVRPNADSTRFLMTSLPKPGFDPELKAILEEQKKTVTLEVEGLGTFTLNRSLGWFEAGLDWLGREVSLTFDQAEEGRAAAQETARTLLAAAEDWDGRVRGYAADVLLDRANQLLGEDGEEELTREEFLTGLEPDSILVGPEGAFEFWFDGEDFFLTHPVHVTGNLIQGPVRAEFEE